MLSIYSLQVAMYQQTTNIRKNKHGKNESLKFVSDQKNFFSLS